MRLIDVDELVCRLLKEPRKTSSYGRAIEIVRAQPIAYDLEEQRKSLKEWIPSEEPPASGEYVLLSFENFSVPLVGRYEKDEEGDGAFYVGDDVESCISQDIIVNAWMPLPELYKIRL